ncbi:MAG: hypothetical protein EBT55_04330, partial [Proteobacteria bacterium]|nr:hypothetical protein [Pseudomonadota bacterium]
NDVYYFGNVDKLNELNGKAIIEYGTQQEFTYTGEVKNGLPSGKGNIFSSSGDYYYQGSFENGLPNGEGIATIGEDAAYEGVWNKGVLNCKDGKVITFTIENGIPNFDVDNKVKVDKEEENTNTSSSYACGFLFDILKIFCDPLSSCMPQKAQFEPLVKLPNEDEKYL